MSTSFPYFPSNPVVLKPAQILITLPSYVTPRILAFCKERRYSTHEGKW